MVKIKIKIYSQKFQAHEKMFWERTNRCKKMHCKNGEIYLGLKKERISLKKKDVPEKEYRHENSKVYSRNSKFRVTKKWVRRKRKLDFMLNNNPLGVIEGKKEVRCTTGGPIQRKLDKDTGRRDRTDRIFWLSQETKIKGD